MMEIVKRGKLRADRVHSVTCTDCKSRLRFTEGEAEYVSDQRDGDALKIKCPVCDEEIFVAA